MGKDLFSDFFFFLAGDGQFSKIHSSSLGDETLVGEDGLDLSSYVGPKGLDTLYLFVLISIIFFKTSCYMSINGTPRQDFIIEYNKPVAMVGIEDQKTKPNRKTGSN